TTHKNKNKNLHNNKIIKNSPLAGDERRLDVHHDQGLYAIDHAVIMTGGAARPHTVSCAPTPVFHWRRMPIRPLTWALKPTPHDRQQGEVR
ncbi:hypothetical protein, partial [Streptomyces sp. NPDC056512]|uniref:hypothetical protein n=1 Tax=Streptomyces sp. NPDC056512 TaxID=3345846 RepID=UPI00367460A7